MAVRVMRPEHWKETDFVEVEDWAYENRFTRTHEPELLRLISTEGRKVHRAVCYRPDRSEIEARDRRIAELEARLERLAS